MRTLLVGDSHVRRFENYVKGSLRNDTFIISDLGIFDFCGISGGSIANHAHTRAIISAVRNTRPQHGIVNLRGNTRPQHVIVNLRGNDLDSSEDIECIIYRLVSFASLLKRQFHICTVVILVLCIVLRQGTFKLQQSGGRSEPIAQIIRPKRWYAILEVERLHKQCQQHF